jgi:hypothetical protein
MYLRVWVALNHLGLSPLVTSHASPFIVEGGHAQRYWAPTYGPRDIMDIALRATNVHRWGNLLMPWHPRSAYPRRAGEDSCIRDGDYSAPHGTGALFDKTRQARRLQDDPDVVCQRSGQYALNAERAHRLSAWWQLVRPFRNKCRDHVALEALRQALPVGLCHGPQATWQQRVSAWAGSAVTQCKAWTRASTGPLLMLGFPCPGTLPWFGPYSEGPGAHPRDPACLLGCPGP